MANASQEQKVLLELFQKFHVQAGLSITEIREITAKVFVELEVPAPSTLSRFCAIPSQESGSWLSTA